ncbi:MAG: transposase [Sphingomonadales bacterium]|nr:transposase [Sphingomonadales bacterium]MDE2170470.1 transposase [Sphingomonadales bacterium]
MDWFAAPDGRPGRPLRFSGRAIEFCLTLKGLFQLPLRQVTGLTQSLLRMAGLDWPAPDYTTLCRRHKSLSVHLGGRPNAGGLHLLVESTGATTWQTSIVLPVRDLTALNGGGSSAFSGQNFRGPFGGLD